jgi:hypothetical protein
VAGCLLRRAAAAAAGATTADVLLNLLGELLEGITPDLRDIVLILQQILQNMDIYSPLNLSSQLRDANLDVRTGVR